jgi:hypothetical protein
VADLTVPTFRALAAELERRFAQGVGAPWSDRDFEMHALEAFALQFESIDAYRGFCEGRGRTPATLSRWQDVPAVPATAFKHIDFVVGDGPPEAVFRTSGTTRGGETRGRHLVPRLSVYLASLLPPFRTHVLGDRERLPFLSLIPAPADRPDSSLSYMVGAAADALASETRWLVDARGALDVEGLRSALARAAASREPVLLLGTSLSLLHAVEGLEAEPTGARLPVGSRIMETGGFKGSGREIGRAELHARIEATMGVPSRMVVGEYGMTELLSQLYEPVRSPVAGDADSDVERVRGTYVAPPWLRVRALDPITLDEMPEGIEGLLAFFDLANIGSVCHVLTEDLGSVFSGSVAAGSLCADHVRLSGRAKGAEPRGCSLAMDELMSAARSAR